MRGRRLDTALLRQNKRNNLIQTFKLIAGMAVILAVMGYVLFGKWGALAAVPIALVIAFFGPRVSPFVVLRMFRARMIHPDEAPQLYEIHSSLCQRAGLDSLPPLFYIPSRTMIAFATGMQNRAAIAISDGLLRTLTPRELAGVLGHEISHISHNDIRIMSLADSFSRFASTSARAGLLSVAAALLLGFWQGLWRLLILFLAPAATALLQLALSRSREFNADMGSAELTRDPAGLASALAKLERLHPHGWLERLGMPTDWREEPTALRTHPPTRERIERLLDLVPQFDDQPNVVQLDKRHALYPASFRRVRKPPGWHAASGYWY